MPFWSFTRLTAAGSLLWNTVWIVIGHALGTQWEKADEWHGVVNNAVIAVLVLGFGWPVFKAERRQRRLEAVLADELD